MTSEHYAKEATRLLADETLKSAFSTVYNEALEAFKSADATDTKTVLRLQAKALVVEEVLSELRGAVLRMAPDNGDSSRTIA